MRVANMRHPEGSSVHIDQAGPTKAGADLPSPWARRFHVKHQVDAEPEMELQGLLAYLRIELEPQKIALLVDHLRLVLAANSRLNLTAIGDLDAGLRLHIVDSLAAYPELQAAPAGPYADLGAGAGYPGIPLGVASERPTMLVESVRKKADFLRQTVSELALGSLVGVYPGRAEGLARTQAGGFSVVTARAVAQLASLVELACPLLREGGSFVALKGTPSAAEIAQGDSAAQRLGMRRQSLRTLVLPGGDESRTILSYVKFAEPDIALPRADGRAQHHPLA